jgi:hypothetical protein
MREGASVMVLVLALEGEVVYLKSLNYRGEVVSTQTLG